MTNELKQWTLEQYRGITKWLKENGKEDFMRGNQNAYRESLQKMGYTRNELEDQAFINKEIQRLREETRLTKKEEILKEFWHDFSNDLYCFDSSEYDGVARHFKGYSKGLKQAGIIEMQEHLEIMIKIDTTIREEKFTRENKYI
jgi:hypothetical protein